MPDVGTIVGGQNYLELEEVCSLWRTPAAPSTSTPGSAAGAARPTAQRRGSERHVSRKPSPSRSPADGANAAESDVFVGGYVHGVRDPQSGPPRELAEEVGLPARVKGKHLHTLSELFVSITIGREVSFGVLEQEGPKRKAQRGVERASILNG